MYEEYSQKLKKDFDSAKSQFNFKNAKDFQFLIFSLPNQVQYKIIEFLIDNFENLKLISTLWYYQIYHVISDHFIHVEKAFTQQYQSLMYIKYTYTTVTAVNIKKQSLFRLDRNFLVELDPKLKNQTVTFGFKYKNHKLKDKNNTFFCYYKFDVTSKKNKTLWIHKEECKHNFDEEKYSTIQPVVMVPFNDYIKFSINFYSLHELIDIQNLEWLPVLLIETPHLPDFMSNSQPEVFDAARQCEIEELYYDWFDYKEKLDEKAKTFEPALKPQFQIEKVLGAGAGIFTFKIKLKAVQEGFAIESLKKLGINIVVLKEDVKVTSEIKRRGLSRDLESVIELKVGDDLIFYWTSGE